MSDLRPGLHTMYRSILVVIRRAVSKRLLSTIYSLHTLSNYSNLTTVTPATLNPNLYCTISTQHRTRLQRLNKSSKVKRMARSNSQGRKNTPRKSGEGTTTTTSNRKGGNNNNNGSHKKATPVKKDTKAKNNNRNSGAASNSKGRGSGGKGKKGSSSKKQPQQREAKKPLTAEELDASMDDYWLKSKNTEIVAKKLDDEMDSYWEKKGKATTTDGGASEMDTAPPASSTDAAAKVE